MPDALGRTPSAPTANGTKITTDVLLKDPKKIERVIAPSPATFMSDYLFRRDTTTSGAVIFNQARSQGAYPTKGKIEEIAPGADFPLIDLGEETVDTAVVTKFGAGFRVYDESVDRKSYDEVNRALMLTRNALVRQNAYRLYQAFIDAGVPEVNAVAAWNSADADPRRDVRKAQAAIKGHALGYRPRTVIAHSEALSELELNPLFANWLPRETANLNPFLSEGLHGFLSVEYIEHDDMPEDEVIILQRGITGVDVVEKETNVEPIRESGQKTLYQVARRSVPIVTDPLAAMRIRGVLS